MLSGRKLQFLRIKFNMTQKYIAESVGVTTRFVGMVENKNESMSEENYKKWIDTLYSNPKK